jgi:rubrerythrin
MSGEATVKELFQVAIALEKVAEKVYRGLQIKFSHHPEVADFWKKYASEEAGHARVLERFWDKLSQEKLAKPVNPRMLETGRKLLGIAAEQRLDEIKNLEDAYQMVNELESSEMNAIFEFMITEFSGVAETQSFLRSQLSEHIGRLMTGFPERYRDKASRLMVKALE